MPRSKKTQTDKPRKYHAEFRLTESWRFRDKNPDERRYYANYESKFKPGTDEHTIDFWEEVLNCFGPLKTPYDAKIRLYRKSDDEAAPLKEYDNVDIDSCEAAFETNEKDKQNDDIVEPQDEAEQPTNNTDTADNTDYIADETPDNDNQNSRVSDDEVTVTVTDAVDGDAADVSDTDNISDDDIDDDGGY